jgi:acyl transferase domain-containing protein/acyl carrier protein
MTQHSDETGLEIAIVGMAGRFPQANDLAQFWQNLCNGVESLQVLSDQQLAHVDPAELQHPHYVKVEGAVDDLDRFDASFFGYSPREAEILDPQQRWFLETAWTALEDAGYSSQQYSGAIGVFAGAAANRYLLNLYGDPAIRQQVSAYQLMIANDKDFLTSRVAYNLNLKGPAVTVQTACSSSLVAVHLACQNLLSGESDMALAGGVSLSEPTGYRFQEGGIYSPDGHCRPFDALAQGTVAGNGVGVVVLKRLEDAIQDGDSIYAVIKGSAINNDGSAKVSYTAPSIEAQAAVIRSAQLAAEVHPDSISYIEAHGTGTSMGDPIEVAALTQAFRQQSDRNTFCALGSLKSNIGHLDAAAGIAGLIKTALALHHRQIPPILHAHQPNPQLNLAQSPFYLADSLQPWIADYPRRAGVSSFGIGGTNAHVIVQEIAQEMPEIEAAPQPENGVAYLFPLSAKTATALSAKISQLQTWLTTANPTHHDLANIAYSLQVGRQSMEYRNCFIASSLEQISQALQTPSPEQKPAQIAFLFSGQGSQYADMAKFWYDASPYFRRLFDRGVEILESVDLRAIIYGDRQPELNKTQIAQPGIFLVEYALAKCLMEIGIQPQAMLGHSIGEYVAATLAGVFSFEDALLLIRDRAEWMQACPEGAMLSVGVAVDRIQPFLEPGLTIAAYNAPELCAISGDLTQVTALEARLVQANPPIVCRRLQTSHGFHSNAMQSAAAPLLQRLQQLNLTAPKQLWISNLTGDWMTAEQAIDPNYWVSHLLNPVQISQGLARIAELGCISLEVGPGTMMTTLMQRVSRTAVCLPILHHPQGQADDRTLALTAIAQAWRSGSEINWETLQSILPTGVRPRRLHLPTYPFEDQRYWIKSRRLGLFESVAEVEASREIDRYHLYAPTWVRSTLQTQEITAQLTQQYRRWLILSDGSMLVEQLIDLLQDHGQDVIQLKIGDRFEQTSYRQFCINPTQESNWQEFLAALENRELLPDQVISLWAGPESFAEAFWQTVYLVRSLAAQNKNVKVSLVSNQSHMVLGDESIQPKKSMLASLVTVINQELTTVKAHCIDLVLLLKTPESLETVRQIISEALRADSLPLVAYRGNYRWQPHYQVLEQSLSQTPVIKADCCYAVVGEVDTGLGKRWIDWLNSQGAKAIAISDTNHELSGRLAEIGSMAGLFYATPMSQPDSMASIAELDRNHWDNVQTKISGLQAVIQAVDQQQIPFCCVQSSLSSVLGGLNLGAYAAANAAMDSLIAQRQGEKSSNTLWYCINWDHYQEIEEPMPQTAQHYAVQSLRSKDISTATASVLQLAQNAQIILATGDLQKRIKNWVQPHQSRSLPPSKNDQATENHGRPNLPTLYVEPRNDIEQAIAEIWQDLLGIQPIGAEDSFFDLGGHSLLAVQTVSRIRDRFGVDLPIRSLLSEAPTVAGVAAAVKNVLPSETQISTIEALLAEIQTLPPEAVELALNRESSG